jgi:hypothetical protein
MSVPLYKAVLTELNNINPLLWLTPYLGERKAILESLKSHLEKGDKSLAAVVTPAELPEVREKAAEKAFKALTMKNAIEEDYGPWLKLDDKWSRKVNWCREDGPGSRIGMVTVQFNPDTAEIIKCEKN